MKTPGRWLDRLRRRELPSVAVHTSDGRHEPIPPRSVPRSLRLSHSTEPAAWIEDALAASEWATVASILPGDFEAYVRILHPAYVRAKDGELLPITWTEVAQESGAEVHPRMSFEVIAGLDHDPNRQPSWGRRPFVGDDGIPDEVVVPLVDLLRDVTRSPERCWFCLWEGYGQLSLYPELERAPRVRNPGRDYLLFEGAIELARDFPLEVGPEIWWPGDRSWCVATDIDIDSTYVGGSRELIDSILTAEDLEAFSAVTDDPL